MYLIHPKNHFFLGVKSSQPHFSYNNFTHPLEQTTIFGIKPFRANQYVGKPMCVEATEYIESTTQILSNSCHIDHRRQPRHLFLSSTQSPLQWPCFQKMTLSLILSRPWSRPCCVKFLSAHFHTYFSVPLPTRSTSSQSEEKTDSSFFPALTDFGPISSCLLENHLPSLMPLAPPSTV